MGNRRKKGIVTLAHMLLCVLARLKLKRILMLQKCYDKLTRSNLNKYSFSVFKHFKNTHFYFKHF